MRRVVRWKRDQVKSSTKSVRVQVAPQKKPVPREKTVDIPLSGGDNHGSEVQQEVMNREGSRTPITIIREGSWRIAAWAASHQWRGLQTIEGFTHPDFRRRGCCRAAVAMLVASEALDPSQPVAIFSPDCLGVAQSLGFADIRLYELFGDDWRLSAVLEHKPLRWSPPGGAGE